MYVVESPGIWLARRYRALASESTATTVLLLPFVWHRFATSWQEHFPDNRSGSNKRGHPAAPVDLVWVDGARGFVEPRCGLISSFCGLRRSYARQGREGTDGLGAARP